MNLVGRCRAVPAMTGMISVVSIHIVTLVIPGVMSTVPPLVRSPSQFLLLCVT